MTDMIDVRKLLKLTKGVGHGGPEASSLSLSVGVRRFCLSAQYGSRLECRRQQQ